MENKKEMITIEDILRRKEYFAKKAKKLSNYTFLRLAEI